MDAPVVLRFVPFELPIAVPAPPEGEQWIHEIKFDGYRTHLVIDHGRVSIFSRRGLDWTSRYPGIAASAKRLPVDSAIIDGEAVLLDANGASNYSQMVKAVHKNSPEIVLVAFDLLHLEGRDLRKQELIVRRKLLRELVPDDGNIQFSEHGSGMEVFEAAKKLGLEGIVSKRAAAPYRSGPSRNWLKTKNYDFIELSILGVVQEAGKPPMALVADPKTGRHVGQAAVVLSKVNRDFSGVRSRCLRTSAAATPRSS
jgi:bifunctional non-homologous end joining protein LigD